MTSMTSMTSMMSMRSGMGCCCCVACAHEMRVNHSDGIARHRTIGEPQIMSHESFELRVAQGAAAAAAACPRALSAWPAPQHFDRTPFVAIVSRDAHTHAHIVTATAHERTQRAHHDDVLLLPMTVCRFPLRRIHFRCHHRFTRESFAVGADRERVARGTHFTSGGLNPLFFGGPGPLLFMLSSIGPSGH